MTFDVAQADHWALTGALARFRGRPDAHSYTGRVVLRERAEELRALMLRVADGLVDKSTFRPLGDQELAAVLDHAGRVLGIFVDDRLVAYGVLAFPGLDGDNMGRLLALPETALRQVAQLESSAVDPDWRGNGLQGLVIQHRMRFALDVGFSQALGHVSPHNPVSLLNVLGCGLAVAALGERRPGYPRFICHRDLTRPVPSGRDSCQVGLDDLPRIDALLQRGYRGVGYRRDDNSLRLVRPDGGGRDDHADAHTD